MGKMVITVNKARCISSGDCVEAAPGVFELDEEGKSQVYNPTGGSDEAILAAARSCPVKAITIVDAESGVQIFPPIKI
jgi:ferredoxin